MATQEWFYRIMGDIYGPFGPDELRQKVRDGVVVRDTEIMERSANTWRLAGEIQSLFEENPAPRPAGTASSSSKSSASLKPPKSPKVPEKPDAFFVRQPRPAGGIKYFGPLQSAEIKQMLVSGNIKAHAKFHPVEADTKENPLELENWKPIARRFQAEESIPVSLTTEIGPSYHRLTGWSEIMFGLGILNSIVGIAVLFFLAQAEAGGIAIGNAIGVSAAGAISAFVTSAVLHGFATMLHVSAKTAEQVAALEDVLSQRQVSN